MNDLAAFKLRCESLLILRALVPPVHDAADRFASDFLAYSWLGHCENSDGFDMLDLLEDSNNLVDPHILDKNISTNLLDLIPQVLLTNVTFKSILAVLLKNKGKGIGVGELLLPLIINDWRFSTEGDGWCLGGRREIKNNGASLKPVATGTTEKGIIDRLNHTWFNGLRPGGKKEHENHAAYIKTLNENARIKTYASYFGELYPGRKVATLSEEIAANFADADAFNQILGRHVLDWYQQTDGWQSLIIIDPDTFDLVNIADVSKIDDLPIRFRAVMARGRDTQAVPDGYVNISLTGKK